MLISKIWYHPKLYKLVDENIKNCPLCLQEKPNSSRFIKIGKSRLAEMPRQMFHIDITGGLKKIGKYSSIVSFMDSFSQFIILVPIATKEAGELLNIFKN